MIPKKTKSCQEEIQKNLKLILKRRGIRVQESATKFEHDFELGDIRFKRDMIKFLEMKSDAYRLVLRTYLVVTDFGRKLCFKSYQVIADMAGVSRKTVITMVKEFISDGFMIKAKRIYQTCVLKLSNIFRENWVKRRLRAFYAMILFLPASLLLSFSKEKCLSEYYPLLKEEKNIYLHDMHVYKKKKPRKHVFLTKKEKSCNMSISSEHMELISQVKFVKLTRRGITELVKFSPKALKYALTQVPYMSPNIKNKFTWFCKMCWEYTKANGGQLNYMLYDKCKNAALRNDTWSEQTHEEHVMKVVKKEAPNPYAKEEWRLDLDPAQELLKAKESGKLNPKGLAFLESCGLIPVRDNLSRSDTLAPVVDNLSTVETCSDVTGAPQEICYTNEFDEEDTGYDPILDPFGDR